MHKRRSTLSFCIVPVLLSASLAAAPRDDGERAFQAGDFSAAATHFEEAIAQGDDSNATRYNLAVSYFRQGDTAKANANFRQLYDRGSRSADVLYSLAVTEKLLGNTTAAVELFSTVAVNTSALADEALAQLEEMGLAPVMTTEIMSGLSSAVQVTTGYNDALVEVQDGKLVRNGDMYAETYAALAWQRPFANRWGLDVNLSLYNNTYRETEGQNFSLVGAGVQQTLSVLERSVFWTFDIDASQLDESGFQQSLNAGLGIEDQHANSTWRLSYRYRHSTSLDTAFDPYNGEHHRVQADYVLRPFPRHQLAMRAYYETINRDPVSNAQSTLDLSRDLRRIDLTWSYRVTPTIVAIAGLNYGDMRADAYQRFIDGTQLRREEDNVGYSFTLRKGIWRNLNLQLAYSRNDNDSTLDDFTYDQSVYEIGFLWTPGAR